MRLTITGNITADPELKFLNSGMAVAKFTVADNYKRNKDADDEVSFVNVELWGSLAENFAESISKGNRVFVEGRMKEQRWETEDGSRRSKFILTGESAGPDLRFNTALLEKGRTSSGGNPHEPAPKAEETEEFF